MIPVLMCTYLMLSINVGSVSLERQVKKETVQFNGGRLQSSRVCFFLCRKRHTIFSEHQCQVLSDSCAGGRRGLLLLQAARSDVVHAQEGRHFDVYRNK